MTRIRLNPISDGRLATGNIGCVLYTVSAECVYHVVPMPLNTPKRLMRHWTIKRLAGGARILNGTRRDRTLGFKVVCRKQKRRWCPAGWRSCEGGKRME